MDKYEMLTILKGEEDKKMNADFIQSFTLYPGGVEGERTGPAV